MIAPANGLARIPDALGFSEAAPLLCAGVTTFNSLRHSRALPGDLVAVHGIGGLGHLASSLRANSGSMLSPFRVGRTNRSWRCDWVRTFTSTLAQRIQ
jgi:D-arabinose 1-dehydrogenase-like Zn-dependent alcohol dehydrogenase